MGYAYGPVKPWVKASGDRVGPMFGISNIGGYRVSATDPGGHPAGLALDYMVTSKAQGDKLAAYLLSNANAENIDYLIWWQRIWSRARANEGWRPMEDRGSRTANHYDHVHANYLPDPQNGTGGFENVGLPEDVLGGMAGLAGLTQKITRITFWWTNPNNILRVAGFTFGFMLFLGGLIRLGVVPKSPIQKTAQMVKGSVTDNGS